jgi:hypothetical protein
MLANLALVAAAIAAWRWTTWGGVFWFEVIAVNTWFAFGSAFPHVFRTRSLRFQNDALMLWHALRAGANTAAPALQIETTRQLRELLLAIGDYRQLQLQLLGAAVAWLELGDADMAEAAAREAEDADPNAGPVPKAYIAIVRASAANELGRVAEAEQLLQSAEETFKNLRHDAGLLSIAGERAELLAASGDGAAAARALDALHDHPLVRSQRLHRKRLLAAKACCIDNAEEMERLLDRYRALRPSSLPSIDAALYRIAARCFAAKGDSGRAAECRELAMAAIAELDRQFTDEKDRARFRAVQQTHFAETITYPPASDPKQPLAAVYRAVGLVLKVALLLAILAFLVAWIIALIRSRH